MVCHKNLTGTDIHVVNAWTYADETARLAASGFVATDIGKVAYQEDNQTLWLLVDDSPITWAAIGGGGTFLQLSDTPNDYTGQGGKGVRVNSTPDGLEFYTVVESVFGRTGAVTAQSNDYTWAQIDKTVSDLADLTTKNHDDLDNLDYASAGHTGFEPTVTKGNLTENVSGILTIVGGTGAIIGSGTAIEVAQAGTGSDGYLSSTDWNTFDGKQDALSIGNLTSSDLDVTGGTGAIIGSGVTLAYATDSINDTHIDWGTGTNQISADDIPDGSTNAIITLTQETNFGTAYSHSQTTHDYAFISGNDPSTNITAAELETLSDTSNADSLHAHAHNSTTGLQGGTSAEYYHLTSAQHTNLTAFGSETGYLLANGTRDLTGDWTIASNNILMTAGQLRLGSSANYIYSAAANRLNINSGLEEYHSTQLIRMDDTNASAANRIWLQIYNKDNALRFEVGSIANGNPQIRFNVIGNTRIGFPASDPTYFAFINDYSDFWLANSLDTTMYFNYYNGDNMSLGSSANRQSISAYIDAFSFNGPGTFDVSVLFGNRVNMAFNTGNGTKIGTTTAQKIGFWNATPIVRPSSAGETIGFTAGSGTGVNDDSTFTGNVGATAYTIGDVVKHLKNIGLIAP